LIAVKFYYQVSVDCVQHYIKCLPVVIMWREVHIPYFVCLDFYRTLVLCFKHFKSLFEFDSS